MKFFGYVCGFFVIVFVAILIIGSFTRTNAAPSDMLLKADAIERNIGEISLASVDISRDVVEDLTVKAIADVVVDISEIKEANIVNRQMLELGKIDIGEVQIGQNIQGVDDLTHLNLSIGI